MSALNPGECKRRVLHVRKLFRDCWARFRATYMNELRQVNAYRQAKGERTKHIRVGEVCLIKEDSSLVRMQWKRGKVLELVAGNDGMIRGAKLKVLLKSGQQFNVYRPVQRLIPFEIQENCEEDLRSNEDSVAKEELNEHSVVAEKEVNSRRPRRKAAIEAQDIRRLREIFCWGGCGKQ